MLPTKFRFIWPNGFRGKESKKSANQKQELPVVAIFNLSAIRTKSPTIFIEGFPIDASYQVSVHLAKWYSEFSSRSIFKLELFPFPHKCFLRKHKLEI